MKLRPAVACLSGLAILTAAAACSRGGAAPRPELPDTLRIGTLYSPTSLFLFRGDTMGYEFERVSAFADDKGMATEFTLARNMESAIQLLDSGAVDIIAFEVPVTAEYRTRVLHCGEENITHQVLVQSRGKGRISDVTQLVGKEVWVEKESKYESRLANLDNEIGGGIVIHTTEDSLTAEDLIELVAAKKIQFTIVDSDIAQLNATYYPTIDVSMPVSFPQKASWAVRLDHEWLADSVNVWCALAQSRSANKRALKRYFEMSKSDADGTTAEYYYPGSDPTLPKGAFSVYDSLFKRYSDSIGWDWRLLAAQAWVESKFDTTVVSWAGARGLMQIMPGTARAYGITPEEAVNPEKSIQAACASLGDLKNYMARRVPDPAEREKFVIAAYNSGLGHVADAMALAQKYGKDPALWEGNVEEAILWKTNPEYYNDEVCRFGYFRGRQTVVYVRRVMRQYKIFCQ